MLFGVEDGMQQQDHPVRNTRNNLKGSARNFNCSDEVNMAASVRGPSLFRTARENEQTLVSEAPEMIMSSAPAGGLSCGLGWAFITNFSIISTRFVPVCVLVSVCFSDNMANFEKNSKNMEMLVITVPLALSVVFPLLNNTEVLIQYTQKNAVATRMSS